MLDVFSKVCAVKKDSKNPHFKSNYASYNAVDDAIRQTLIDCGLGYSQVGIEAPPGMIGIKTIVFSEDGASIESNMYLPLSKQDPQGAGSAITYARRYALICLFGLQAEDDDGNVASNKLTPRQELIERAKRDGIEPYIVERYLSQEARTGKEATILANYAKALPSLQKIQEEQNNPF